jgi:Kef-type K+ transport system membrane component KefB
MFIVGMELDLKVLRKRAADAAIVSYASILIPFFLGTGLALYIYQEFAPANISFTAFALFLGISMSITAFPVLARIVLERGMARSPIGTMALTSAATGDVMAWCILAIVIAIVKAGVITGALMTIALSVIFVAFMLYAVRPLLNRVASHYMTRETISKPIVALIFGVLFLSSYLAELIGIHALFGAFLAGVIIPSKTQFRHILAQKLEDVSLVLLLPLFFVFTGLRTQVGLLNSGHLWGVCAIIILVAIVGKFLGSALTSKMTGQPWKDSLIIGALMNTRGLMEMVVLNIGYELGILNPEIFTMLVIMALTTTFMTGPAIDTIEFFFNRKERRLNKMAGMAYHLLISFGSPRSGSRLLELAVQLGLKNGPKNKITALHLSPSADISMNEARVFELEGFRPIVETARSLDTEIKTEYRSTNDVSREIIQFANGGTFSLMLVGSSRQLFSHEETGGKVRFLAEDIVCPVAVLIDRGFNNIHKATLIVDDLSEQYISEILRHFMSDTLNELVILDKHNLLDNDSNLWGIRNEHNAARIRRMVASINECTVPEGTELLIVSMQYWNEAKQRNEDWINYAPSILVVSAK